MADAGYCFASGILRRHARMPRLFDGAEWHPLSFQPPLVIPAQVGIQIKPKKYRSLDVAELIAL
jgi:hypothetical protein